MLTDGTYFVNRWFATVEKHPKTVIPIGFVGVVVSYHGESGEDVTGERFRYGEQVEQGGRGVWKLALPPGKYALNPYALKVELASVSLSPEFAQHVRARIATDQQDHLELLGRELSSVGVSPEFAVRVRQQIESSPARPRWCITSDEGFDALHVGGMRMVARVLAIVYRARAASRFSRVDAPL